VRGPPAGRLGTLARASGRRSGGYRERPGAACCRDGASRAAGSRRGCRRDRARRPGAPRGRSLPVARRRRGTGRGLGRLRDPRPGDVERGAPCHGAGIPRPRPAASRVPADAGANRNPGPVAGRNPSPAAGEAHGPRDPADTGRQAGRDDGSQACGAPIPPRSLRPMTAPRPSAGTGGKKRSRPRSIS
jgi:hypothetical protein